MSETHGLRQLFQPILPPFAAECIGDPSKPARTYGPRRCWCSAASTRICLETNESREYVGLRTDRTSVAFRAERESGRQLPPQSPQQVPASDECGTGRG